jgi:hypothetical protein
LVLDESTLERIHRYGISESPRADPRHPRCRNDAGGAVTSRDDTDLSTTADGYAHLTPAMLERIGRADGLDLGSPGGCLRLTGVWTEYGSKKNEDPSGRPEGSIHAWCVGGAKGIRTPDLLNAIQTLSQLSYSPTPEPGV